MYNEDVKERIAIGHHLNHVRYSVSQCPDTITLEARQQSILLPWKTFIQTCTPKINW